MANLPLSPTWTALLAAVAGIIFYYGLLMWKVRAPMREVRRLGKPMPPWSPLLGNLITAGEVYSTLPPECHSAYMIRKVSRQYAPDGAFYFDAWPMMEPMLVVSDPAMAQQAVLHPKVGATKPQILQNWFHPITGGPSLFDTNGAVWKSLHDLFAPAFAPRNLIGWDYVVIDRARVFREILTEKAEEGIMFDLEKHTLNLITDIIGEILLSMKLNTQRGSHPLFDCMSRQLNLKFSEYKPQNLLAWMNPFLYYRTWKNSRELDQHIREQLHKRYLVLKEHKSGMGQPVASTTDEHHRPPFKSVIDMTIESFLSSSSPGPPSLPESFLRTATINMRMFFFAGYDSTSTTLLYTYLLLYRHPHVLARLRAEHDSVFGSGDAVFSYLHDDPSLLFKIPYTQAVIKESMRLFPAAGGIRAGDESLVLRDDEGRTYPTKGFAVLISHLTMQTDQKVFPRPEEFIPDRWLVQPGHELYPPKGGWRPFEHGPRLCLGQALVMSELKAILACTVRDFDIVECYEEMDAVDGTKFDLNGVGGERAYMIESGAAHPKGGLPCRIRKSNYRMGKA